jgi:aquaporin Z
MDRYLAEFFGTFALVFVGCGAAVLAGSHIGWAGVALAFGLTLLVLVFALGPISGCHLNPAVTIGLACAGRIRWPNVPAYAGAQIAGALAASALLLLVANGAAAGYDAATAGFAANGYGEHSPGGYGALAAFLTEMLLTMFLVFTVLTATAERAPADLAGLPIGFALAVTNLVAIPVTNASINPARSIGPAVFVGGWALAQLWLFILAPIAGGVLAAFLFTALRQKDTLRQSGGSA